MDLDEEIIILSQKVERREKLAQKVGRLEIYSLVPPPSLPLAGHWTGWQMNTLDVGSYCIHIPYIFTALQDT